ncbi:unnamed protein product [Cylindrotheca closterium]|uniref:Uncharacterized protein n=1 Tax=Cylindrotheca closterium TaxID=2856 RepID=A0AAD2G959_9STRA|nr:unnamed protein product [Cylindrotheca closterium]CAJ1966323.1 unnamed protein product [Cylindrotheca closterium]CAJ1966324.1 unnamed protein product [Cylindrotheca closterium]
MMESPYRPQPHNNDAKDGAVSSLLPEDQPEPTSPKPRVSPRQQRRFSPWAVDLNLQRGGTTAGTAPSSRTQCSTSSWKMSMQQRKAVYGEVAVAEDEEEESDQENGLDQPSLDHDDEGPTPQQKALQYIQEQRKQKELEAIEKQQKQQEQQDPPSSAESKTAEDLSGLGTVLEDLVEEEEEEEEVTSPDAIETGVPATDTSTTEAPTTAAAVVNDENEGLSEMEIQRKFKS